MVVEEELLERLCSENMDFKKLLEKHYEMKEKIQEFDKRKFLTAEDELEIKNLKKVKLKEKDLMMQMVEEYRSKDSQATG